MTIEYRKNSRGHEEYVVTVECPICGKKRGDGWKLFSVHLRRDHTWEEVGLV